MQSEYGALQPFRQNVPQIVSDMIDGEVIIINLDNGTYYSLTGAGALTWELLTRGTTLADAAREVALHFDGDTIEDGLRAFWGELSAEGLIVESDTVTPAPPHLDLSATKAPFVVPHLESFTDMKDLLFLDPIHEVDEKTGWPARPPTP